jgi:three-Cys-motif partner protein
MNECAICREDKIREETGICPIYTDNGLPLRCMGIWANEKLLVLSKYIDMFTMSMYKHWSNLVYIDMFCGTGKGIIRDELIIIDGSPIKAFQQKHLFTHYVFVDINRDNISTLKTYNKEINKDIK